MLNVHTLCHTADAKSSFEEKNTIMHYYRNDILTINGCKLAVEQLLVEKESSLSDTAWLSSFITSLLRNFDHFEDRSTFVTLSLWYEGESFFLPLLTLLSITLFSISSAIISLSFADMPACDLLFSDLTAFIFLCLLYGWGRLQQKSNASHFTCSMDDSYNIHNEHLLINGYNLANKHQQTYNKSQ